MKKFRLSFVRTVHQYHSAEIEAPSLDEAERMYEDGEVETVFDEEIFDDSHPHVTEIAAVRKRTFTFHRDPGHGWLEVPADALAEVGLKPSDLSGFSYQHPATKLVPAFYYLEEDCDTPLFDRAYRAKFGEKLKVVAVTHDFDCFIRKLPRLRRLIG